MDVATSAAQTAAWLRDRDARRRASAAARADRLHSELPSVVEELKGRFGCTRVLLFGSLAMGNVHEASDVDLWVEGFEPARHFEAMAAASARLGVQVDLVRAEDAPVSLRQRVAAEGVPQ
jgi:predicted nucleotidyltransferase